MRDSMFQEFFKNTFASEEYKLVGLCLFGSDAEVALATEFADVSAGIRAAVDRCVNEHAEVALALGQQKSFTIGVDRFLENLQKTMEDNEDALSVALGGRESEGFLAFYPQGRTEFNKLARKKAPAVMARISKAVNTYAATLDARLKSVLLQLEVDWKAARGGQLRKMDDVDTNRGERRTARQQLEDALWEATLTVLLRYRNDPDRAKSFFREELLKRAKRSQKTQDAATT
ncbi:MAG: hypothetical protein EOO12_08720 [Chitinophagaceae bacterium]|nr:MAG: hypothetical protein EOO12_08720 [Chitinophagaceae bacterium]